MKQIIDQIQNLNKDDLILLQEEIQNQLDQYESKSNIRTLIPKSFHKHIEALHFSTNYEGPDYYDYDKIWVSGGVAFYQGLIITAEETIYRGKDFNSEDVVLMLNDKEKISYKYDTYGRDLPLLKIKKKIIKKIFVMLKIDLSTKNMYKFGELLHNLMAETDSRCNQECDNTLQIIDYTDKDREPVVEIEFY